MQCNVVCRCASLKIKSIIICSPNLYLHYVFTKDIRKFKAYLEKELINKKICQDGKVYQGKESLDDFDST